MLQRTCMTLERDGVCYLLCLTELSGSDSEVSRAEITHGRGVCATLGNIDTQRNVFVLWRLPGRKSTPVWLLILGEQWENEWWCDWTAGLFKQERFSLLSLSYAGGVVCVLWGWPKYRQMLFLRSPCTLHASVLAVGHQPYASEEFEESLWFQCRTSGSFWILSVSKGRRHWAKHQKENINVRLYNTVSKARLLFT